jgi:hypothetical protein
MALSQNEQRKLARIMQHAPAFGGSIHKTVEHLAKVDNQARNEKDDAERRLTDGMNQSLEWDALHGG